MNKPVILIIFIFLYTITLSQSEDNDNMKKLRYGFNLGANYSNMQLKESLPKSFTLSDKFGFRLGVILDYSVSNNISFSPKAELSFNNSQVEFPNPTGSNVIYKIFPSNSELMLHINYKIGNGKMRPYILAGPGVKLLYPENPYSSVQFKTQLDFAIDFGIGLENLTQIFIFAPELRYSLGLLDTDQNVTRQSLNFHNISLTLNFK